MLKHIATFTAQKFTVIDRLIIKLGDEQQSSLCILQEQLPTIFRVTAIDSTLLHDGTYEISATIYHDKAQLDVLWHAPQLDSRLSLGELVSIRWKGKLSSHLGQIVISRLVPAITPNNHVSLFSTVPAAWCEDRAILERAAKLVGLMSEEYHYVLNTLFWNGKALHALVSSPSFSSTIARCESVMKNEYKFFINLDQTILMLLIHASDKQTINEKIIDQIVETRITQNDTASCECWTTLLQSMDY